MYVPPHFPRYRPTTVPSSAPALPAAPAPSAAAGPPLTLEWLVARDIDAYTARRKKRVKSADERARTVR